MIRNATAAKMSVTLVWDIPEMGVVFCFLNYTHPSVCEAVSQCDFDMHFPMTMLSIFCVLIGYSYNFWGKQKQKKTLFNSVFVCVCVCVSFSVSWAAPAA